jgi:hypothetical protein
VPEIHLSLFQLLMLCALCFMAGAATRSLLVRIAEGYVRVEDLIRAWLDGRSRTR